LADLQGDTSSVATSAGVTLDPRRIYIMPTREGMYFVAIIFFMIVAGINYQNSLVFAVAFLLASLFMVAMLHTYRNLAGLTISGRRGRPAFVGEDAEFPIAVESAATHPREALQIGFADDLMVDVDLIADSCVKTHTFLRAVYRGWLTPGPLLVRSRFPVGVFRAWSRVGLEVASIVYPSPRFAGEISLSVGHGEDGQLMRSDRLDDFHSLRAYAEGDSLAHVAWKSYARTGELMVKEFAGHVDRQVWLDWEFFSGLDVEARLARLCYWVLALSASGDEYGLRLPGLEIEPASGDRHRERVLKELALFRTEPANG